MKKHLKRMEDMLADAALLETGVARSSSKAGPKPGFSESLEEKLVEIAYAEAADYDDIHDAILMERSAKNDRVHFDECQYGDNDVCFAQ